MTSKTYNLKPITCGIVGFGHMGKAFATGLKSAGFKVAASSPSLHVKNTSIPPKSDVIIIAVRPQIVSEVLREIAPFITKKHIVISIAAGTPLRLFEKYLGPKTKLVRVMPNLPAQIGKGVSGWIAKNLSKTEKQLVEKILGSCGETIEVQKEDLINAITAVSGSGSAYVFAFLETLQHAAQKLGISQKDARRLAIATLLGGTLYAKEAGLQFRKGILDFQTLKNMVQTKGGTTEAAFKVLNKRKWQQTLEKAILNAYKRALIIEKSADSS